MDVPTSMQLAKVRGEIEAFRPKAEEPSTIERIRKAYRAGMLTLVLGAGASDGLNFPNWDILVDDLVREAYEKIGLRISAASIKRLRNKGRATNSGLIRQVESLLLYSSIVRSMTAERLYRDYDKRGAKKLIRPLCELFLLTSNRHRVRHVINYNFDNVVQRELHALGQPSVKSIYSAETYPVRDGGLRMYHPHGFIPHPEDDPDGKIRASGFVFSERDYNRHFMDAHNWANVLQLHHFMNRTCLFIGVSMTDPNMRRLLDYANSHTNGATHHVSFRRMTGKRLNDYFVRKDLGSLGVEPLWVREYKDIPKTLGKCVSVK